MVLDGNIPAASSMDILDFLDNNISAVWIFVTFLVIIINLRARVSSTVRCQALSPWLLSAS